MTVGSVLTLAAGFLYLARVAPAVGQADQLQTSADAAALAGAQAVSKDFEDHFVRFVVHDFQLPSCGVGSRAAQDFAHRNDATVVSYCYYPVSDEVRVTIRSNAVLESGRHEERSAAARIGFAFAGCSVERPTWETPTPTPRPLAPAPTPGATPSPPPPPPPAPTPKRGWVHCRDLHDAVPVVVDPDGSVVGLDIAPGQLKKLVRLDEPRLVR